jgi:hypothetical protein
MEKKKEEVKIVDLSLEEAENLMVDFEITDKMIDDSIPQLEKILIEDGFITPEQLIALKKKK